MHAICLDAPNDFAEWRDAARGQLRAGRHPDQLVWRVGKDTGELFDLAAQPAAGNHSVGPVPPRFIDLASLAINHADPERFALLYGLLWRLQANRNILDIASDPDVTRLTRMASAVRRDSHKMKAFVRFRQIVDDTGSERFAAWFEPDHFTLELTAPFFARRFAGMIWAIVTPYRSAFWDGTALAFGPGGHKSDVPSDDAVEADWKTYFSAIFNPARLKVAMMKSEMPVKYWRNLPEAELIAPLVRGARQAEQDMIAAMASQPPSRHLRQQARSFEPQSAPAPLTTLDDARAALQDCRRCALCQHATQPVFGEGPAQARLMFVGEQPGDQEDLTGRPFIGPAGQLLDGAIAQAGIARERVYLTNAVKHFKFSPRGKRRIHQRPDASEVQACKFWLDLEIAMVHPAIIVALGATAAHSLLGRPVTISQARGAPIPLENGTMVYVTNHPSYLLRLPDPATRERERTRFDADLARIRTAFDALG